jgi:hypothetical protein
MRKTHGWEFFTIGGALLALGGFTALFDRADFDWNFFFIGGCSIAIGLLERRWEAKNA